MQYKIMSGALLFILSFGAGIGYTQYQEYQRGNFKFDGHWIATSSFTHLPEPLSITSQAYISDGTALFHDYYNTLWMTEKYFTSSEKTLFQISKYRLAMRLEMQQASQDDVPMPRHKLNISTFYPINNDQFFIKYETEYGEDVYFLYGRKA
ncbi:hypothetical protein [Thaumasiovibrio sp. DFM-14]|uniref:hypothetical protein n=1 Tax=Thaumasiovibrio sp. DFM-14 TaxID=3384792 RepID=UPI0039A2937F